jgi:glycosyltransferase involved in cell wall biosynthesis
VRPRISVGLPFANNRSTIEAALRSIFAQTEPHWELLLADDGSADGTLEVAAAIRDPRVRLLGDGVRRGLAFRLNEIALAARAPLLARMDADDQMHPERLARQLATLEAEPGLELVGSGMIALDGRGLPTGRRRPRSLPTNCADVLHRGFLSHPTVTGRRQWFLDHPYVEGFRRAEDLELWCRVAGRVRARELPEPLLFYREPVPVNLAAYRETFRARRRITRHYGPAAAGWPRTLGLLARTWVQPAAYVLARAVGLEPALVARRNCPLTEDERRDAEAVLRTIENTPLPLDAAP